MTSPSADKHQAERVHTRASRRRLLPITRATVVTGLLGLTILAAGCGGSSGPGTTSSGSIKARDLAYSRCMRSHDVSDFPDPTISPGGAVAIQVNGGPGSDLNPHNPTFKAAKRACRALLPTEDQASSIPAQKIAAELTWARCMRAHGVPSFPDPNSQGVFNRSKFNESSPAFQTASKACASLQAAVGPTPVSP
jgi:hypothetical protein